MRRKTLLLAALSTVLASAPLMAAQAKELPLHQEGTSFTVPDDLKGAFYVMEYGNIGGETPIYETDLCYVAMPEEDVEVLKSRDDLTDEESENFEKRMIPVFVMLSVGDGGDIQTLQDVLGDSLDEENIKGSRTTGDFTHFLYMTPMKELPEDLEDEYKEEYASVYQEAPDIFEKSELGIIYDPLKSRIGETISFETTDLDGNPVSSEELFGSHEVTLVNLWTTWCTYCKAEMSELEAINSVLADHDAAIVGILADGTKEDNIALGKEILKENGVTYLNLAPPENLSDILPTPGYPTNYFVNKEGKVFNMPYDSGIVDSNRDSIYKMIAEAAGIDQEEFTEAVAKAMDKEEAGTESEEASAKEDASQQVKTAANDAGVYRIFIVDEDGKPIPEAAVQFCSDTQCMMEETDENGMASFKNEPGSYTVHVLEAPDGYLYDDEAEYSVPSEWSDLTITLKSE